MTRRLSAYVHVRGADGGMVAFGPDDDVPGWAAEQIKNPKAWADDDDVVVVDAPSGDGPDVGGGEDDDERPPRSGKGSSLEAWRQYATDHGVAVPDDASRDDIIEAVEASS